MWLCERASLRQVATSRIAGGSGSLSTVANSQALSGSSHWMSSMKSASGMRSLTRVSSSRSAAPARWRKDARSSGAERMAGAAAIAPTRFSTGNRLASERASRGKSAAVCAAGKLHR
jgi:hypothetical protein